MTRIASEVRPGWFYYRIYLPPRDQLDMPLHFINLRAATRRSLINVPMIVVVAPGREHRPTIPNFYFS